MILNQIMPMTSRKRVQATLDFAHPDRIPVVYHPSPAGLHVHGRKLLDLFNRHPPDNYVCFETLPVPPSGTVNAAGEYSEIRRDEWGTVWEHTTFGIHGIPSRYPFAS